MTPLYGWAEIGKRVFDQVPHGHWKTTTFLAALRHEGLTAPMVVDGAINGELFLADVEQILLPTLQKGDIVVMDNLSLGTIDRPFDSLRTTRSHEVWERWGVAKENAWIGHSEAIRKKHYKGQFSDEAFAEAAGVVMGE